MRREEPPVFEDDRIDWERKQRHKKSRKAELEDDGPFDELEVELDLMGEDSRGGEGKKRRKVRAAAGSKRNRRSRQDHGAWPDWE